MFTITTFYLAINAIIFAALSMMVVRLRMRHRISLGDGDNDQLRRASRAFGNNAEYIAVVILLLAMLEINGAPAVLLHAFGLCYTLGRLIHALAIYGKIKGAFRVIGMALTYSVIILSSLYLLYLIYA